MTSYKCHQAGSEDVKNELVSLRPRKSRGSWKLVPVAACLIAVTIALAGCGGDGDQADAASHDTVTVKNCGEEVTFPSPAKKIFVNESQMISNLFALDADSQISAVTGLSAGKQQMLKQIYGEDRIAALPIKSEDYAGVESVLAERPDAMMAGFGWGYSVEDNLTPARLLDDYDIPAYTSSPTCPQESTDVNGIMPPWEALYEDLTNIGEITGHSSKAANVLRDIKDRLKHLETAPQPENAPTVFFYDLTAKEVMSAGSLSPAQAVIDAAGGTNVLEDIDADFTKVSWERLTADKPDYFLVSDYGEGEQSYSNKISELKSNPATRDLEAVKNDRFIKLPIQMLLGTPEMIDAAEHLRKALEDADLVPESDIKPELKLDK